MLKNIFISTILLFSIGAYSFEYEPGKVIVKFKKAANTSSYAKVSEIKGSEFKVMKIDSGKDVLAAVSELASNPDVEYAQPSYIYRISRTPDDTLYASKLWGLNNTPQTVDTSGGVLGGLFSTHNPGTAGDDINAESAWDVITSCSSIVVAVLDTGIRYTHEDLSGNMWDDGTSNHYHGYDYVNHDNFPLDDHGHGTHVAGIIGAYGSNTKGVTGVCWRVQLMAIKACDFLGSCSETNLIAGIDYAIAHGANIINTSFNMYGGTDDALSAKVTEAQQAGVLIVAAAGNGHAMSVVIPCSTTDPTDLGTDPGYNVDTGETTYPCNFTQDNILCVAALDQKFERACFSNYGATSVDVAAPGTNIVSTWGKTTDSAYAIENGTSMATPYAVGVAALIWANNPNYNYSDVKNAVMYGGTAISSMSGITVSGNVLNAYSSLSYINRPVGLKAVVH